jgi:5-(carboxyamino)imidazole ribonucleotide synthase
MSVLLPGATIGMLGGGQLGRMAALAARRMGYRVVVLDPTPHSPAGQVADGQIEAPYGDEAALCRLAEQADAVTLEFENLPATALDLLARRVPVRPHAGALRLCQDRLAERAFLGRLAIPVAPFVPIRDEDDLARAGDAGAAEVKGESSRWSAGEAVPFPALLKTATLGYDSKGQRLVTSSADLAGAYRSLGGTPCILEQRIDFEREISVIVARDQAGATATYEPAENVHVQGILDTSMAPAPIPLALALAARELAARIARVLDLVGLLAVELFVTPDGRLLVNEMAPRPHNSGHWSIEASVTSQFEQQARITAGAPVGDTAMLAPAAIANLLGDLWQHGEPRWDRVLALPDVHLHLYGKSEPRPGRKMGHLTAVASTAAEARARVLAARALLLPAGARP